MVFSKLLVPIDGSEPSLAAASVATKLAHDQHASVVFCHALDTVALLKSALQPSIDPEPAISEGRRRAAKLLDAAIQRARDSGVDATGVSGEMDPVPFILSCAKEQAADLVVIGTHGRSGLSHALLGSTAEGVVRRAGCPVLVTRR